MLLVEALTQQLSGAHGRIWLDLSKLAIGHSVLETISEFLIRGTWYSMCDEVVGCALTAEHTSRKQSPVYSLHPQQPLVSRTPA